MTMHRTEIYGSKRYEFPNLAIILEMEKEDDNLCKSLLICVTLTKNKNYHF